MMLQDEVHAVDKQGQTALHRAAAKGNKQRIEQLLAAGASPEARTLQHDRTALHLAAAAGHAEVLSLLITPTTLDMRESSNYTALQLAVHCKQLEAATVLVAAGASLRGAFPSPAPFTLAMVSLRKGGSPKMAVMLLDAMVASPDAADLVQQAVTEVDSRDDAALHQAAALGHQELVVKLLEAGADKDAAGYAGATPLWAATSAGHAHLVPLLATPTNIEVLAGPGFTPLYTAVHNRDRHTVAALLAAGAHPTAREAEGKTPLGLAAEQGVKHLMAQLLEGLVELCRLEVQDEWQQQKEEDRGEGKGEEHNQQQQQQQQQHKEAHKEARLAEALHRRVAWYLAQVVLDVEEMPARSQLVGMALDVLGPETVSELCWEVQELLVGWQKAADDDVVARAAYMSRKSRLAEALLLGWLGAVERLYDAEQPVFARLQRLVVYRAQGQQQRQEDETDISYDAQPDRPCRARRQRSAARAALESNLQQLTVQAEHAAAAGDTAETYSILRRFAVMYVSSRNKPYWLAHTRRRNSLCAVSPASAGAATSAPQHSSSSIGSIPEHVVDAISSGLDTAASLRLWSGASCSQQASSAFPTLPGQPACFHPLEVCDVFLAAWVDARQLLQELPQNVFKTVLEAVAVAVAAGEQQDEQGHSRVQGEAGREVDTWVLEAQDTQRRWQQAEEERMQQLLVRQRWQYQQPQEEDAGKGQKEGGGEGGETWVLEAQETQRRWQQAEEERLQQLLVRQRWQYQQQQEEDTGKGQKKGDGEGDGTWVREAQETLRRWQQAEEARMQLLLREGRHHHHQHPQQQQQQLQQQQGETAEKGQQEGRDREADSWLLEAQGTQRRWQQAEDERMQLLSFQAGQQQHQVQGKAGDNNTSGVGPPQQQQQQQQHTDGEEGKKGAQQVQHKPGTGRTLAWLLPALVHVHQQLQQEQQQLGGRAAASSITTAAAASSSSSSSRAGVAEPSVLVVTPSRELVQQVASVYKQLQADTRFGSAAACSGVDQQAQQQMLQHRRTLLLVATPGRLLAMLSRSSSMAGGQQQQQQQQGWLSLARVQLLVLDNEDRMGSMSSWAQLERFVAHLPRLGQPAASGMVAADAAGCDAADQPEKRRVRKTQHWLR